MTHKSTDELKNELKTAANLRDYLSKNKENLLTTATYKIVKTQSPCQKHSTLLLVA